MIRVAFFFQILPKLHFYLLHLVKRNISRIVGSASACQARDHGFDALHF